MFLNIGKGKEGVNYSNYILTLGVIIAAFSILGYAPLYITMYLKGIDFNQVTDMNVVSDALGLNVFLTLILVPYIVILITLLFCVRYMHKAPYLSVFTIRKAFDWNRFWFSFLMWGSVLSLFLAISYLSGSPILLNFDATTFFMLLLISIFILPLQTTCEEVLFRGYLFQGLGLFFKKGWLSVLITGVLFGLMHGANPEVDKIGEILLVFYILNGVFLGVVALMDDGLELTMGYHAVNNIFAALIVTNEWQSFQTDALFLDKTPPGFGVENVLTLLIIQPLLLYVFAKKYKWTNWKKRFFETQNFKIEE